MSTRFRDKRDSPATVILSRIIVILFILVIIYPVIFVVLTSLKSTKEFFVNIWWLPREPKLSNFPYAWRTARIGEYFFNSFVVVVVTMAAIGILGSMAGYALARLKVPGAGFIMVILLGTTMLPSESVIMPLYIMVSRLKLSGSYFSLIIPYIGWGLPLTIIIFRSFIMSIPNEVIEAARLDGCNESSTFFRIIVPLMKPPLATTAIFNFVFFWGELLWATIVLASTSSFRTIPLGVLAFKSQFATDWGPLSASIVIVLLPLVIFFLFTQKYFIKGLTAGSVKG